MALRFLSASCALSFGLLLGYMQVLWSAYVPVLLDWRTLFAALCVGAGIAVFAGASVRYVSLAMGLAVVWRLTDIWFTLPAIVEGIWQYSRADVFPFAFDVVSVLGLALSLAADGQLKKLIVFIRRWPQQKVM